jgi:hypothetical protein
MALLDNINKQGYVHHFDAEVGFHSPSRKKRKLNSDAHSIVKEAASLPLGQHVWL